MPKNDGIHTRTEGFNDQAQQQEAPPSLREQLDADLRVHMRKHLEQAMKELEDGSLHGLVIVRVNQEHAVAGSVSICNESAARVASKMQDYSMDLMLSDAPPQVRGLLELLRKLESKRPQA